MKGNKIKWDLQTMNSVAEFHKIVKNYLKMIKALKIQDDGKD